MWTSIVAHRVRNHFERIFSLRGAINHESPILYPVPPRARDRPTRLATGESGIPAGPARPPPGGIVTGTASGITAAGGTGTAAGTTGAAGSAGGGGGTAATAATSGTAAGGTGTAAGGSSRTRKPPPAPKKSSVSQRKGVEQKTHASGRIEEAAVMGAAVVQRFQNSQRLLAAEGTPVQLPDFILHGFAQSAGFLTGAACYRRYCVRNVFRKGHMLPLLPPVMGPARESLSSIYDIILELDQLVPPDMIGFEVNESSIYSVLALHEAELFSVCFAALDPFASRIGEPRITWTHRLLLQALLTEVFCVPATHVDNFDKWLRTTVFNRTELRNQMQSLISVTFTADEILTGHAQGRTTELTSRLWNLLHFQGSTIALLRAIRGELFAEHSTDLTLTSGKSAAPRLRSDSLSSPLSPDEAAQAPPSRYDETASMTCSILSHVCFLMDLLDEMGILARCTFALDLQYDDDIFDQGVAFFCMAKPLGRIESEVLALGGRYDGLISRMSGMELAEVPVGYAVEIDIEKVIQSLCQDGPVTAKATGRKKKAAKSSAAVAAAAVAIPWWDPRECAPQVFLVVVDSEPQALHHSFSLQWKLRQINIRAERLVFSASDEALTRLAVKRTTLLQWVVLVKSRASSTGMATSPSDVRVIFKMINNPESATGRNQSPFYKRSDLQLTSENEVVQFLRQIFLDRYCRPILSRQMQERQQYTALSLQFDHSHHSHVSSSSFSRPPAS